MYIYYIPRVSSSLGKSITTNRNQNRYIRITHSESLIKIFGLIMLLLVNSEHHCIYFLSYYCINFFKWTYYGRASSVCPSVCADLVGRTVSSKILQLGTFDQNYKRKMSIVSQCRRSKVKVVL